MDTLTYSTARSARRHDMKLVFAGQAWEDDIRHGARTVGRVEPKAKPDTPHASELVVCPCHKPDRTATSGCALRA